MAFVYKAERNIKLTETEGSNNALLGPIANVTLIDVELLGT